MPFWNRNKPTSPRAEPAVASPLPASGGVGRRVSASGDAGRLIRTSADLEAYLREMGAGSGYGPPMTAIRAMQSTAIQTCLRLIAGGVSNTPLKAYRWTDDKTRIEAKGSEIWKLVQRKPNYKMRPAQFFRQLVAFLMLRGNWYGLKVRGGNGHVTEIIPLHPDRVNPVEDMAGNITYNYTRKDGKQFPFTSKEVLHLYLLTFDGVVGITPITHARTTLNLSLTMEEFGSSIFSNGARVAGIVSSPKRLGEEGRDNIRAALEEFRDGGSDEGKELFLEEGTTYERIGLTAQDAQWIESRKFTAAQIFEIFGVPLHMTALADKSSNWGTGVSEQGRQFAQWVLRDYFVAIEQGFNIDVIAPGSELEVEFDRSDLIRGDVKAQTEQDKTDAQFGIFTVNEIRRRRGANPTDGGDERYPPPNMNGEADSGAKEEKKGEGK